MSQISAVDSSTDTSLLVRPKIKLAPHEIRLANLYADQAALRVKICTLGILDSFLETKRDLAKALRSIVVTGPLVHYLQNVTKKIKPLGQFYLTSGNTTQEHIGQMLTQIEGVRKQLPPSGAEKVSFLLTRLTGLYQQAQRQLESDRAERVTDRYSCRLVGLGIGYYYLPEAIVNQMLPMSDTGEVKKTLKTGSRPVNPAKGAFWKAEASAPLVERAFHRLGKIGFSLFSAPTELATVTRRFQGVDRTFYVQASLAAPGIGMDKIVYDFPEWLSKLDPVLFGLTVCQHMVGNPQDAKFDNYQALVVRNKDGEVVNLTWKGIDEDQCFAHPICRSPNGTHFINVRSFFFFLPQMRDPIHPDVRAHFETLNPHRVALQWLQELWEENQKILEFWRDGHITAEAMHDMQLPLRLLEDLVPSMVNKLKRIKSELARHHSGLTYMELFKKVMPELAYPYDLISQKFHGDPVKSFRYLFLGGGPVYEELMSQMLNLPLVGKKPLSDYLKGCNHSSSDFESARNTSPEKAAEQLLQIFDFELVDHEEQQAMLKILYHFPLTRLTLQNCEVLTDVEMVTLMRAQPNLERLSLINCHELTDASLQIIASFHPHIDLIVTDCEKLSTEALASFQGYLSTAFKNRETIILPANLFPEAVSAASEQAMHELAAALQASDWKRLASLVGSCSDPILLSQMKVIIIDSLLTTDQMRTLVRNNSSEAFAVLNTLEIPLTLKNAKGTTFFHLCCEERNSSMLAWLCQKPVDWTQIVDQTGATPCHTAVRQGDPTCLKVLIAARAPVGTPDNAKVLPLQQAIERGDTDSVNLLLAAEVDATQVMVLGNNALHIACQAGVEGILALLLERCPSLADQPNREGRVPLYAAIEYNHLGCCSQLIARMKTVEVADARGVTPAMFAAQFNRAACLKLLLGKVNLQSTDQEGMTATQLAALSGSFECLILLLGETPSSTSLQVLRADRKSLLHLAAISGSPECVGWLCQQKLSVTALDEREMTPGHYAAARGKWDCFSLLLASDFPIDYQENTHRETSLMVALRGHHFGMVDEMMRAGANLKAKNRDGHTCLHLAAKEGDCAQLRYLHEKQHLDVNMPAPNQRKVTPLHLAAVRQHLPAVELLLACGAQCDARDSERRTPLHSAMQVGAEEVARLLVRHGADVMSTMSDGCTPLHYAAHYTHPILADYLLSLRPELVRQKTREDGHTPLHRAMYQAHLWGEDMKKLTPAELEQQRLRQIEVIKILLRYGAEIDAGDNFQYVPLHLAAKRGRPDFARLLLSRGARTDICNASGNTPEGHARHMVGGTTEESKGISEVAQLLHDHDHPPAHSKPSLKIEKTLARLLQNNRKQASISKQPSISEASLAQPFAARAESFLRQLQEDKGFRKENLVRARTIEGNEVEACFTTDYRAALSACKLTLPQEHRPTLNLLPPVTPEQICTLPPTDELICLFPYLMPLSSFFAFFQDKKDGEQLKAVSTLITHFRGHEALTAADFLATPCKKLAKQLKKIREDDAVTLLKNPSTYYARLPFHQEWRRKVANQQQNLFARLEVAFQSQSERKTVLDNLVFTLMKMHREWLLELKLSDFRPDVVASRFKELEQIASHLRGNCLVFLMMDDTIKRRTQRFEFVIDWMSTSLLYGDFHQAFTLYLALSHPAIARMKKCKKTLNKDALQQWMNAESLFSASSHYQNYWETLSRRLTPSIPALALYRLLFQANDAWSHRYPLLRHFQEHRGFARSLILPSLNEVSEYQLFLTPDLFPRELSTRPDGEPSLPGEGFAWTQSRLYEPPKH